MQRAETAGAGSPFDVATVLALQGDLHFKQGDLAAAAASYDRALSQSPEVVTAQIGRARVLAAGGSVGEAIAALEELTATIPIPGGLILLGELLEVDGRPQDAAASFELVRTVTRLQEAAGAHVDLELALFEVDHGDPMAGLSLARSAYAARPTVFAADALAWALRTAGDPTAALPFVEDAVRLGTADSLLHFHAAGTLADVGQTDRAAAQLRAALDLNPWFSFSHRGEASALAARLGVVMPNGSEEAP